MQGSRAVLLTLLMCVCRFSMMSEVVEMRVRAGDDVTIYSDCVWKVGLNAVWFKNSSCECQPPLIISTEDFMSSVHQHYSLVWNPSNNTHDLLVKNFSESDLGLYYCALHQTKVFDKTYIQGKDVYHYGNRSTRLSLLVTQTTSTSTPPVSDCSVCWKLLVSVCPVCVLLSSLLSSTCVYFTCRTRNKAEAVDDQRKNKRQSQKSSKKEKVEEEDEVCYASLDLPSGKRQKHLKKKKRAESSDFSTYSEVKTERL